MNLGYAGRVGAVVLLAVLICGGIVVFFKGFVWRHDNYRIKVLFDDASGIDKGVDVTMAGVEIGTVEDIRLENLRAKLILSIKKGTRIPVGSQFVIEIPVLGDVGDVAVVPPHPASGYYLQPGDLVDTSSRTGDMNQTVDKANELMSQFQVTITKLNTLLDQSTELVADPSLKRSLHQSLANLDAASKNGVLLTDDLRTAMHDDNAQVEGILSQSRTGTKAALDNVVAASSDLRGAVQENREAIKEIVGNLQDTSAAIDGITQQTNGMLNHGGITKNLEATVANLNTTTQRLSDVAGELQTFSDDPSVQSDLKATLHNLRDTTGQTALLVHRVGHLLGVKEDAPPGQPTAPSAPAQPAVVAPTLLPRVDMQYSTRAKYFRTDVDAVVPINNRGAFGMLGIFGFGDTNSLDLNYGTLAGAGSSWDYRLGLHASKLGVGADYGLGRRASLAVDLYDPNYAHVDVKGTLMLSPNFGLSLGEDDVTRDSSAVIGVELRH